MRNNAIHKRIRERNSFDKNIRNIERTIKSKLNAIDWLIIKKLLLRNIKRVNNLLLRSMKRNYEI